MPPTFPASFMSNAPLATVSCISMPSIVSQGMPNAFFQVIGVFSEEVKTNFFSASAPASIVPPNTSFSPPSAARVTVDCASAGENAGRINASAIAATATLRERKLIIATPKRIVGPC